MAPRYVVLDNDATGEPTTGEVGGKADHLRRLRQEGFLVPTGYVVTVEAFRAAFAAQDGGRYEELLRRMRQGGREASLAASELRALIPTWSWPRAVLADIQQAHRQLFPSADQAIFAVRSSAVHEDSATNSFAGMYDSVLDVEGLEGVLDAIHKVWSSSFGERVLAYRRRRGWPCDACAVAVLVQPMIDARLSGVMFTCDPTSGDRETIVIDVVAGSGAALVQGAVDARTYRLGKSDDPRRGDQPTDFAIGAASPASASAPNDSSSPAPLTGSQLEQLAAAGRTVERLFGAPQDVEFCFDAAGRLVLFQSRPVTSSGAEPDPADTQIWDNSNIIESYSGVTTPLTFSFIRRAYSIVYQCFAEVMGIGPRAVREHRAMFANMLGLFEGRVYYNLKNWYRLIRLFPGYRYNSRFMESMMGLKEPIALEEDAPRPGLLRRWFVELPSLLWLVTRMAWRFARIRTIVGRFQRRFDERYDEWRRIDFGALSPPELLAWYRHMEDAMLWHWQAPIINDFYVMISYGLLKQICWKWCGDSSGSLQNGLLCGTGGLDSVEPARRLLRLARLASEDEALRELVVHAPLESLPSRVRQDGRFAVFQAWLDEYLDEYGLRCAEELKLETSTHRDRPDRIFQIIRDYLQLADPRLFDEQLQAARERQRLGEAEEAAFATLARSRGGFWKTGVFRRVLACARLGIRNRENLRFARTKIYGIARAMFRAIGEQFARAGALDSADDVFYLTTDEVWDFVQGTAVTVDLRGLVATRRREYDAYRASDPPPPDRLVTVGAAYLGRRDRAVDTADRGADSSVLRGLGCCPGIVEGAVQIVRDPTSVREFTGDILVAPRTDPGWVLLFPAFRAMLIERGSVLSHSAIVAREMGIPTVVRVGGLLDRLRPGQRVRVDGMRGTIEILAAPPLECVPALPGNGAVQDRTSST